MSSIGLLAAGISGVVLASGVGACAQATDPVASSAPGSVAASVRVTASDATAAAPLAARAVTRPTLITAPMFGVHPGTGAAGVPAGSYRLWGGPRVLWRDVQPSESTPPDWTALDAQLALARSAGVTDVLFVFGGTPQWASSAPNASGIWGPGSASVPNLTKFAAFVRNVATHFKGRISSYEAWNEINESSFWLGTPAQAAALTRTVHDVVKQVYGRTPVTVTAASITTRRAQALKFLPGYLAALRAQKWPVDVFNAHVYPIATGGPAQRRAQILAFQKALVASKAPARPLWDTEINYGLPGMGKGPKAVPGAAGAAWLARTYLDSIRTGVARTYWYSWSSQTGYLGIRLWNATPATAAFTTLRGWLVGSTWRTCTGTTVVSCTFTRGRSSFVVAWSEGRTATVVAPRTARTVCSVAGTRCSAVPKSRRVSVSGMPVKIG